MTAVDCGIFMFSWSLQSSAKVKIYHELTKLVKQRIVLSYANIFTPIFFPARNN